jgi:hypothetical protein
VAGVPHLANPGSERIRCELTKNSSPADVIFGTGVIGIALMRALQRRGVDLDAQLVRQGTVIAAYSSPDNRPQVPFWPLLFANVTLRLLDSGRLPYGG